MKLNKPKFWDYKKISFWSTLLLPLSLIYVAIFWIIKILNLYKTHKKNCTIICVGNIYLGGTGKTPLVKEIFRFLKSKGKKPSFIKKNYDYLIDEIRMLNEAGETFCHVNRKTAIDHSITQGHDIAILDDGFQDFSIKPDFSIICFNSKQLIGNGFVIPSGPLRETLSSVARANCVVINGEKTEETSNLEKKIKKKLKDKEIHFFYSKYKIKNIEKFKNKDLIAFAGIGNPSNFFDLLRENDLNIKKTFSFPDHYNYSQNDLNKILENGHAKIITTQKDYYRMTEKQKENCDFLEVELKIENREKFEKLIENYL